MPKETNPTTQTTPTNTTLQTKKPLNWKLIGIISIVALLLIGSAGYAAVVLNVFDKKEEPTQTTTTTNTATPSANTTKETPKDETAGWKTFADNKGGFSIKYPSNFTLVTPVYNPTGSSEFTIKSDNYSETPFGECLVPIKGGYVYINANNFNFTSTKDRLTQLVEFERNNQLKLYKGVEGPSVVIDRKRGVKFIYTGPSEVGGACGISQGETLERTLTVSNAGVPYVLDLRYFTKESGLLETFNKMVSTFKFI